MNTLAHSGGPGPWVLLFPLVWAAVVIGIVTLLRRTVWRGRRGPWGAARTPGAVPAESSPIALLGRRFAAGRSTRRSTGADCPCWTSSSAGPRAAARRDPGAERGGGRAARSRSAALRSGPGPRPPGQPTTADRAGTATMSSGVMVTAPNGPSVIDP